MARFSDRVLAAPSEDFLPKFVASLDPDWIEQALTATGTATIRRRRLPAEQVVWLVIGMCIFRDLSMKELVATMDLALPGSRGIRVAPSSIVQARERLGDEPLRWLFERTGATWAHASARAHDWRGWRSTAPMGLQSASPTRRRIAITSAARRLAGTAPVAIRLRAWSR